MPVERDFVDQLIDTIKRKWPRAAVVRPNDQRTIGVPDILAWIPADLGIHVIYPWSLAIEAKHLRPLMADPFHRGRRIGQMLEHPFTGPQVSFLRRLRNAGVEAFGLVRASSDTAFRIPPEDIPAETGNFTHEELVKFRYVKKVSGLWDFWETYPPAETT